MQRYYFHAGKGGVGKSTTSSLTALHLARTGRKVLLVSLDPAHNQADIFDMDFKARPREVAPGLSVAQADIDAWIKAWLHGIEEQVRRTYTYQTAFNLENRMNVIKHSPGLEEYALLLAFKHYREKNPDPDVIIYDMPPTALTMKFFSLPALSLLWLEQLLALRCEIMEKKKIITKIHLGKCEIECDKISSRLGKQQKFFTELRDVFQDGEACRVHIVVNPDRLSFAEAGRIFEGLDEMRIPLGGVLMNKVAPESTWDEGHAVFLRGKVHPLPQSPAPLIGLDALQAYLDANGAAFGFAL
ncbi:ArsA family ATPase [Paucidesulfovibrio longus]|uniref:ArsA family ATPase n=1 Tax=Paucidesulfovibrio longus TaxID=889 RepID=UPI0003B3678A|nr:ArsA family ATPase [Paucidesulfovibrio longus]